MTNFEKYKDEILKITKSGGLAVANNKPTSCYETDCSKCDLCGDDIHRMKCDSERYVWLYEEYKEPESRVLSQQEYKLLEAVEAGWIARDKSSRLYWYENKPAKYTDYEWTNGGDCLPIYKFVALKLPFIKWEDDEPWAVEHLLLLPVEDGVM